MSDTHVVIAMPLLESVKMRTVMSLLEIQNAQNNAKIKTSVVFIKDSLIHDARKSSVLKAQALGATHVLFLDSDMVVEPEVIQKLLAHGKDIIGINYHIKSIPTYSTVKLKDENGNLTGGTVPKELFSCFAVGTGCLLTNVNVFERIPKPWFFYKSVDIDGLDMSEDVWFCQQAQKVGIETWCDPNIRCSHVGDYEY